MTKQNLLFLQFFFLISVVFFFFLLRFNSFSTPFERDEGEYSYSAWLLSKGETPYKDSFLQKPPLIIYTYFLGYLINSSALWPTRVISFLFLVGTIFLIYLISKKEFGIKAAVVSTLLASVMLSNPIVTPFAANTENFLLLPLVGFVALFVYNKNNSKWFHWFLSGVLVAVSLLYKPIGLFVTAFIFFYWQYLEYKNKKNLRSIFTNSLFFVAGGLLTTFVVLLPFVGENFKYLWEEAVVFNKLYASHWGLNFSALGSWLVKFSKYWWIIIPFFGMFIFEKVKLKSFWIGCLLMCLLGVYQTPIGHYYLLLMPFLAIIISKGMLLVSTQSKYFNLFLITTIVLIVMLWPFKDQFSKAPEELGIWIYGTANPFSESLLVGDKVKLNTEENDYVFVAGSEPQIYYYSKRKSPTRFVITYPFIIQTPLMEKYQLEGKNDLERNKPRVIVYSTRQFSGLWENGKPTVFIDYLHSLLKNEYSIKGAYVWNNMGVGSWRDNPDKIDLENASLILYIRK